MKRNPPHSSLEQYEQELTLVRLMLLDELKSRPAPAPAQCLPVRHGDDGKPQPAAVKIGPATARPQVSVTPSLVPEAAPALLTRAKAAEYAARPTAALPPFSPGAAQTVSVQPLPAQPRATAVLTAPAIAGAAPAWAVGKAACTAVCEPAPPALPTVSARPLPGLAPTAAGEKARMPAFSGMAARLAAIHPAGCAVPESIKSPTTAPAGRRVQTPAFSGVAARLAAARSVLPPAGTAPENNKAAPLSPAMEKGNFSSLAAAQKNAALSSPRQGEHAALPAARHSFCAPAISRNVSLSAPVISLPRPAEFLPELSAVQHIATPALPPVQPALPAAKTVDTALPAAPNIRPAATAIPLPVRGAPAGALPSSALTAVPAARHGLSVPEKCFAAARPAAFPRAAVQAGGCTLCSTKEHTDMAGRAHCARLSAAGKRLASARQTQAACKEVLSRRPAAARPRRRVSHPPLPATPSVTKLWLAV